MTSSRIDPRAGNRPGRSGGQGVARASLEGRLVLVTGASGWLGRGMLAALCEGLPDWDEWSSRSPGLRLRALVPPHEVPPAQSDERLQYVRGDLRSLEDCRRFCADGRGALLFHLAGVIHPARRIRELYEVNVEGAGRLLDAAAEAGIERAVIMSSNSPLGCNPHPDHLFDEDSPYRPYMHYGRSKMQLEELVSGWTRRGVFETVVLRAPWFYGPRQPPRQTAFFSMIRDGGAPLLGGGENLRSMTYIDNLAAGLLLAATVPGAAGRTYWIADERPYSMNEIVDTVERLLESEFDQKCAHRRLRLPRLTGEVAGLVDWTLQSLGLYNQKVHVLSEMNKTIACSIDRARLELGYDPRISLEEGMRRSLRWLQEAGGLPPARG